MRLIYLIVLLASATKPDSIQRRLAYAFAKIIPTAKALQMSPVGKHVCSQTVGAMCIDE